MINGVAPVMVSEPSVPVGGLPAVVTEPIRYVLLAAGVEKLSVDRDNGCEIATLKSSVATLLEVMVNVPDEKLVVPVKLRMLFGVVPVPVKVSTMFTGLAAEMLALIVALNVFPEPDPTSIVGVAPPRVRRLPPEPAIV